MKIFGIKYPEDSIDLVQADICFTPSSKVKGRT